MKNSQRTKSRSKLYDAINGTNNIVGAAGRSAVGSIQFTDQPAAGETVTIGDYWFEFQAGASEAPGTSAGTEADPHLVQSTTDLATAGAELASVIIAETTTTGAWGYLYPDNSVGCDFTTDTLTLTFWPGEWANSITLASTADTTAIVQPVTASLGRSAPGISPNHSVNLINTTGSTQDKEYYVLGDGTYEGQVAKIAIKATATDDTPTIIGKLSDTGTSNVEALFATAEPGMYASFMWIDGEWHLQEEGFGTALAFTPAS